MQSELQAARLELTKLEAAETSITEASQSYLKSFFQKRGLYLIEALLLVVAILLMSRLSYAAMERYIAGFRKKHRSFRVRLIELAHRIFTVIMVILGPMIVFYLVEDWVLFSLGILLLLGIALTLAVVGSNLFVEDVQQHVFGDILRRKVTGEVRFRF